MLSMDWVSSAHGSITSGTPSTFREGLLGFMKGIVWPAFLVYELLEFLNKE